MSRFRKAWSSLNFYKEYLFWFWDFSLCNFRDFIYAWTACNTPKRKDNLKSHHMTPLIFHSIVFIVFLSNKCSLGEHKIICTVYIYKKIPLLYRGGGLWVDNIKNWQHNSTAETLLKTKCTPATHTDTHEVHTHQHSIVKLCLVEVKHSCLWNTH